MFKHRYYPLPRENHDLKCTPGLVTAGFGHSDGFSGMQLERPLLNG